MIIEVLSVMSPDCLFFWVSDGVPLLATEAGERENECRPLSLSANGSCLSAQLCHSKWLSRSKFITATWADNQTLSLDAHCLSLTGALCVQGWMSGQVGLCAANPTELDRCVLSWPPPPGFIIIFRSTPTHIRPSSSLLKSPAFLLFLLPGKKILPFRLLLFSLHPFLVWAGPCQDLCLLH